MTLSVFAQQLILSCAMSSFTSYSNVCFYPKTKTTNRLNNKHAPAIPIASLHADIKASEIILNFEDDNFSDIDVTVSYEDTIIYYNHFAHKEGTTISIPLMVLDDENLYSITIKKGDKEYVAHFSL